MLLVGVCVYNEVTKVEKVLEELRRVQLKDKFDVVVCDDGSSDGSNLVSEKACKKYNWKYMQHKNNSGIGTSIRDMINYGIKEKYKCFVTIPGNGKVKPNEIKVLYKDVISGEYDYVKGSRYLDKAQCKNLPLFRKIFIPLYSFFVSVLMFRHISDVTCLINGQNLDIYKDKRININQSWLDRYELEYYVLYYVLKLKLKFKETAINIYYPPSKKNYSKIKPFSGWWSMIRPWVMLKLRIKR